MWPNTNKVPVLTFGRHQLSFGWVHLSAKPKWQEVINKPIQSQELTKQLLQIKKTTQTDNWYVVLKPDSYYLLTVDVPVDINYSREYVAEIVQTEIPEEYENDEWDFIEKKTGPKTRTVMVFAPVKKLWTELTTACAEAGISIVATEAEALAQLRHQQPEIGIALKNDVNGPDKKVLNLKFKKDSNQNHQQISRWGWGMLGLALVSGLVASYFIVGYFHKKLAKSAEPTPVEVSSVITSEENEDLNEMDPATEIQKSIKIQLLNGTDDSDLLASISATLVTAGFTNIETGNTLAASSSSQLQYKENIPESWSQQFLQYLTEYELEVTTGEKLSSTAEADILFIVR